MLCWDAALCRTLHHSWQKPLAAESPTQVARFGQACLKVKVSKRSTARRGAAQMIRALLCPFLGS